MSVVIEAATGALAGGFPLSFFGGPLGGAIVGGGGNLLGQVWTSPCGGINVSSVIGSSIGGALGAAAGNFFNSFARNALESAVSLTLPTLTPSVSLGLIGTEVGRSTGF